MRGAGSDRTTRFVKSNGAVPEGRFVITASTRPAVGLRSARPASNRWFSTRPRPYLPRAGDLSATGAFVTARLCFFEFEAGASAAGGAVQFAKWLNRFAWIERRRSLVAVLVAVYFVGAVKVCAA